MWFRYVNRYVSYPGSHIHYRYSWTVYSGLCRDHQYFSTIVKCLLNRGLRKSNWFFLEIKKRDRIVQLFFSLQRHCSIQMLSYTCLFSAHRNKHEKRQL